MKKRTINREVERCHTVANLRARWLACYAIGARITGDKHYDKYMRLIGCIPNQRRP